MTQISSEDITRLARLSGLDLDAEEAEHLTVEVNDIVGYISQLSQLDTADVEPTYQVTGLQNVWRMDEIEEGPANRGSLLELAPKSKGGQVEVPKVL